RPAALQAARSLRARHDRGHRHRSRAWLHGRPGPAAARARLCERRLVMRPWFRGKRGGFIAFPLISALVVGGLGWPTGAALRLDQEQLDARRQGELSSNLRLALWRLDSLVAPALMKEDSRRDQAVEPPERSEEHTSELQSRGHRVCRPMVEKKKSVAGSLTFVRHA